MAAVQLQNIPQLISKDTRRPQCDSLAHTCDCGDVLLEGVVALAQFAHQELHLVQRASLRLDLTRPGPVRKEVRSRVVFVGDESDEHIAAVVLDLPIGELLLDGNARDTTYVRQGVVDMRVRSNAV